MPNRILRDYTDSLRFDGLSAEAERLFVRLLMKADDYGRFHAEPRLLRAGCFPLHDHIRANDLARWLEELSRRQLILRYEVGGRELLAVVNFGQRLKLSRAKFPPPAGKGDDFLPLGSGFREGHASSGDSGASSGKFPEAGGSFRKFPPESETDSETRNESETEGAGGRGAVSGKPTDGFERFWSAYPKRIAKPDAERAWVKQKCAGVLEKILAAIVVAAASFDWKKEGGQFIPHPATWLKRRSWEDEYRPANRTCPIPPEEQPEVWDPMRER